MKLTFSPRLQDRLLSLWFPSRCLLCGKAVRVDELFCPACREHCPSAPQRRSFSLPQEFCVYAPLPYAGGFRKTLHALKFQGQKGRGEAIGQLMASILEAPLSAELVTWVPMTPQKQLARGYNQSEALARAAARALGLPALPILTKLRETATQHELSREARKENVRGAYAADQRANGKAILLIDDIVTTGSTICECAAALYGAGAKQVVGLCAANAEDLKEEGETAHGNPLFTRGKPHRP